MVHSSENLTRFRYHTGATLRRVEEDEPCRMLFRDIGPLAMARFLRRDLPRLAGPYAPILYTRTADYREPYTDYEPVGRLVFLQPKLLQPWHSGVETIFVASIKQRIAPQTVGFIPAQLALHVAEDRLHGVSDTTALREVLGGRHYDEVIAQTLQTLIISNGEHEETERWAEPLRRRLQSRSPAEAEAARAWMNKHDLVETDLCSAWHHLPRERRAQLRDAFRSGAGCP